MLGVTEKELEVIKNILMPFRIDYKFFAYGSRVKGNFRPLSDLDLMIKSVKQLYYGGSTTEITVDLSDSLANYRMVAIRALWYSSHRSARTYDIDTFINLKTFLVKLLFEDDPANTGHYVSFKYISDTQVMIKCSVANVNIQIMGIK